jgi:hypothetical protein
MLVYLRVHPNRKDTRRCLSLLWRCGKDVDEPEDIRCLADTWCSKRERIRRSVVIGVGYPFISLSSSATSLLLTDKQNIERRHLLALAMSILPHLPPMLPVSGIPGIRPRHVWSPTWYSLSVRVILYFLRADHRSGYPGDPKRAGATALLELHELYISVKKKEWIGISIPLLGMEYHGMEHYETLRYHLVMTLPVRHGKIHYF